MPRQKDRSDYKVFVVMRRQPTGVMFGVFYRTTVSRQLFGDFEVGRIIRHTYGITATFSVPFRFFMCWNKSGSSFNGISPVTRSRAEISPREIAARAALMNRGVCWKLDLI